MGFGLGVALRSSGDTVLGLCLGLGFAFALVLGGERRANSSSSEDNSITSADSTGIALVY
jgi:hypothetical protein